MLGNLLVLAYDTEYAMVDRDDDLKIGMKTSAITLGRFDVAAILAFYLGFVLIWAVALVLLALGALFYVALAAVLAQVAWHWHLIRGALREGCFRRSARTTGLGSPCSWGSWPATPCANAIKNSCQRLWNKRWRPKHQAPNSLPNHGRAARRVHGAFEAGAHAVLFERLQGRVGGAALEVTRWRSTSGARQGAARQLEAPTNVPTASWWPALELRPMAVPGAGHGFQEHIGRA